ncbi:MAG: hypothetical protein H7645_12810 [Candidatus Heimdallarchaeota archaeon]|nr:hypothetical protein [Candidatus Heimdallarchaeota archaeon]MCK4771209.1 hypothetical protein [Candidatus Heimdallarchaeota archaeon]
MEVNKIPDVKDSEKTQIRSRARRFSLDLLDAPMGEGLEVYSEVTKDSDEGGLYQRSARWKICLKCGVIDKKEKLDEKTHRCAAGKGKLPVILPTSWPVLKDFFLTNAHLKALHKLGVEPEPTPKVPVRVPVEQEVDVSSQVPAEEEVEVPVKTE